MSLNLTFTVQGYAASGWESLGYTCLWRPPWGGLLDLFVLDHSFTVQVGVPQKKSYINSKQGCRLAGVFWLGQGELS